MRCTVALLCCALLLSASVASGEETDGAEIIQAGPALSTIPAAAIPAPARPIGSGKAVPYVAKPYLTGTSPAVRDLPAAPRRTGPLPDESGPRNPSIVPYLHKGPLHRALLPWNGPDGALQTSTPSISVLTGPLLTFEALSNHDTGQLIGGYVEPPDTNGAIGKAHYVQTVNLAVQVYGRDGTQLTPPFLMSQLFASLGSSSPCASSDDGDPIALYDHLADRWLISQFVVAGPPFHQCIAISQTGDPTGAYYVYDFVVHQSKFGDYPHFGIWSDGYYMTTNQFDGVTQAFEGGGAYAFDRAKMLAGDPSASYVYFDVASINPNIGGMLPSSLDGPPPPAGTDNVFAYFTSLQYGDPQDGLGLFAFHADFATPANTTFTSIGNVPVAAFDPRLPPTTPNQGRAAIAQPAPATTSQYLDAITDRLMHRLQYRNFGDHESLVLNHTVNVSGDPNAATFRAGVRYYQLTRALPSGSWGINEQATYAPADTTNRWMGSAAMDRAGNLAVGFSESSTSVYPGIYYAARLATDPPNGLAQGEQVMQAGSGVQTNGADRWGDYSNLSVDPVNQCTFWFTSEYYSNTKPAPCSSTQCWQTRVGAFRLPNCTNAPADGHIGGLVSSAVTADPIAGVLVTAGNGYSGVTDASGHYSISVPADTYAMTASKTGATTATASGVTVASAGVQTQDFSLSGVPILASNSQSIDDSDPVQGNDDGKADPGECLALTVPVKNMGIGIATSVAGTLSASTTGVSVTTASANYGSIYPNATAPGTPYQLSLASSIPPGTPVSLALTLDSDQGPSIFNLLLPTGTPDPGNAVVAPATGPIAIPDGTAGGPGAPANLPITVSGLTTAISKVSVAIYVTHTYDSDLTFTLKGPDNTIITLASGNGGSGNNFGTQCPATAANNTVFDDGAATSINGGSPPFSGSFRPVEPLSTFVGKSGSAANGVWTFTAVDGFAADTGSIQCVALTINGYLHTVGACGDIIFKDGFE